MAQLLKSFIPAEFLEAWARGRYVIGPRTLDYQYAGLALMLRGFYRYDVLDDQDKDNKPIFGGYAVASIPDKELTFAGFRIYGEESLMFWKSVFSRFIENNYNHDTEDTNEPHDDNNTELYFPYYVFRNKTQTLRRQMRTAINALSSSCNTIKDLNDLETNIMDAGESVVDDNGSDMRPRHLYEILSELFERADDPAGQPTLQGLCMFDSIPSSRLRQRSIATTSDLELKGKNYGVVGHAIQGTVTFRRLSERFLETLEHRIGDGRRQKGDAV